MSKGWMQVVLVGLPVLMLIGSWLALKTVAGWRDRARRRDEEKE